MRSEDEAREILVELQRLARIYGAGYEYEREAMVFLTGRTMLWRRRLIEGIPVHSRVMDWVEHNEGKKVIHSKIADEVGSTRETVTRAIKRLLRNGNIYRQQGNGDIRNSGMRYYVAARRNQCGRPSG